MINEKYVLDYTDSYLTKNQKNYIAEQMENIVDYLDEQSLEGYGNIVNISSKSYDGFWSWTDGGLFIDYMLDPSYLLGSGYTPSYLQGYVNNIQKMAIDYANELYPNPRDIEQNENAQDEYLSEDDDISLRVKIQFYSEDNEGNGINKLYIDSGVVDNYGRYIHEATFKTGLSDSMKEIEFTDITEFNNNVDSLVEHIKTFI